MYVVNSVKVPNGVALRRRRTRNGQKRTPLTRDRVLRAAIAVADRDGVEAVTMRRLGRELGVEAMALYRHARDKDDIVDAMVDLLVGEIVVPEGAPHWKEAIRARALAARKVTAEHRWARRLLSSRQILGPGMLRYIDDVTRVLRDGGLSPEMGHHAMHLLGARLLGFTQEPFDDGELRATTAQRFMELVRAGDYPAINAALPRVRHDDDAEFVFGLDLVLDALERATQAPAGRSDQGTPGLPGSAGEEGFEPSIA